MIDILLIWVQTVCNGYQQTKKVSASKERIYPYAANTFCPENIVFFLCLLHIFKCTSDHSKTYVKQPLSKRPKMFFKFDYCLMQVKSIRREHSTILWTFIKLPVVIKIFVLSIFEWPFYTDFTVLLIMEAFTMHP